MTLKLRDDAPQNAVTLIRRAALREPELLPKAIHARLDAAGVRASPSLVSYTVSDLRQTLKLLKAEGLLTHQFDKDRQSIEADLVETATRQPKNASRGRT